MAHVSSFEDRTVVVTGASAGVGRATARVFARAGARVALLARASQGLRDTEAEVKAAGGQALALPVDVSDAEAVFDAAGACEQSLGEIDVWVNNAMLTVFSPVADLSPEEARRVTEVTYLGYVHGTLAALQHMRPRNRGVIVQVGSALAYRGIPLQAAYCGAKHAIRGFSDSLRSELLHEGSNIAVTAVHLPAINTPQFDWARTHMDALPRPVPPVYRSETAARAILRAARHPEREYWLGARTPLLILGNMVAPGLFDRQLADHAIAGQSTGRPVPKDRRDNLFSPVDETHRTDGSFAAEAHEHAAVFAGPHTRLAALTAGLIAGAALFAATRALTNIWRQPRD